MHAYGNLRPPSVLDRWPAPTVTDRSVPPTAVAWAAPRMSTRVELPPPPLWSPPNPELLLSITIAPLRFAPVSWGPPIVVVSPWGPPAVRVDGLDHVGVADAGTTRPWFRRPRALAFGVAAVSVVALIVAR